jgi:Rad3-related DNA helicase
VPPGGKSNVDELIADIADRQAESERHAYERCEASWGLPKLTADEAFAQIEAAVRQTMQEVLEYKEKINGVLSLEILFNPAPRTAINCSTGTGKTKAMVAGIAELLRANATMRVVIAVPTHKLGEGLTDRINTAYAFAMPGNEKEALDSGCNAYIAKPISLDNLLLTIESILSTHPPALGRL